jgi:hypothetical protein
MSATTSEPLQVGYTPLIRQDRELFAALQQATSSLEQLVEQHGLSPARRELNWGSSATAPPELVIAHLTEEDEYGLRQANASARRTRWLDPVSRYQMMISLLLRVRGERWYEVDKSIERGIEDLEREERADGKPD